MSAATTVTPTYVYNYECRLSTKKTDFPVIIKRMEMCPRY